MNNVVYSPDKRLLEEIEQLARSAIHRTLSQSYRTCDNPRCRRHAQGPKHGPHLYISYRGEAGKTSGYYVPKAADSEVRRGVEAWSQLQTQLRQLSALNKERALEAARVNNSHKRAEMTRQRKLLRAKQASGEIKSLEVSKIAEKSDTKKVYCTAYAYMSLSVHASSQDLARHLQTDELAQITNLLWGPTHKESQEMPRAGMRLLWAFVDALGDFVSVGHIY